MQTRESKRNKPAAITVAGFVAIIVSVAALLIMFTLPRRILRKTADRLLPLIEQARRCAQLEDYDGAVSALASASDIVKEESSKLDIIVNHSYVTELILHTETALDMAIFKNQQQLASELDAMLVSLQAIVKIEELSWSTLL